MLPPDKGHKPDNSLSVIVVCSHTARYFVKNEKRRRKTGKP